MFKAGLIGVLTLGFGFIVLLAMLPDIVPLSEGVRTQDAQDEFEFETGVGETSQELELTDPHEYPDKNLITVSETSPGSTDRTAATTMSTDRQTLTVSGLTAETEYVITVDYKARAENVSGQLNSVLKFLPALLIFGLLVVAVGATATALGSFRR